MNNREMCAYCAKWFDRKTMTPLHEENKAFVNYYCEKCLPDVKHNVVKLPFSKLYTWGDKGS